MRKKTAGILGGAGLVVVLGAAAFFLLKNAPEEDTSSSGTSSESSTETITLTTEEANNVSSIDVSRSDDSFQVIRVTEGDADNNAVYAVAGYEDLPMSTSTLWTLSNNTASMEANEVVEEDCSDLEKFGLDDDTATAVTLHFDDGSDYSFRIGNETSDSQSYYFATADSDTVYTVKASLLSNFGKSATDFLSTTLLEAPESEDDYPIVNQLTIERKDIDYVLELDYDESSEDEDSTSGTISTHLMVSPVPAYLSVDRSTDVITGMFGLTATAVEVPHPTDEDIASCGLDDPFGTAVMACNDGNTYTLQFSERRTETDAETGEETAYYDAMINGVDAIYRVSEDDMVWATITPTDLASKLVIGTYVWDIGTLDVSVGETKFAFNVVGEDADSAVVTLNGESTDSERYRQFYSFLLNTAAETVDLEDTPQGEMLAEISLKTQDGSYERDLQFYAIDNYTCLITIDGVSAYSCRRTYLDTLLGNMNIYDDTSQDFATNWS